MNKRHYEHTLPNIRGSLSNTYNLPLYGKFFVINQRIDIALHGHASSLSADNLNY